jgi:DNA polymerase I
MNTPGGSVYLIDAHALIYQMFHAIPLMNAPDGRPTNALFGVTRDLLWLHEEVKPDYLLCAFDLPGPTFRDEIYPEYKKNRPPAPVDLHPQVPLIHDVLTAMNLPILSAPGFEADDVMATVSKEAERRGLDVFICTSDKDCRQLIDDRIRIYSLRKREIFDRDSLNKVWGIKPEQVVDFQTLVGDSVDNVPGVAGVGEKTAAKLLQEYQTLDNLVAHVDEIKQAKLKENLKKAIATGDLEKSRRLVRLDVNMPLAMDWDGWRLRDWDGPRLLELLTGFGFRSFSSQVRATLKTTGAAKNTAALETIAPQLAQADKPRPKRKPAGPENLFSAFEDEGEEAPAEPVADNWNATYTLIDTPEAWQGFLEQLRQQKRFAFDLETTGLDPLQSEIVGLAFSWKSGEGWYVPVKAPPEDKHLEWGAVLNDLAPTLANPAVGKVNQNIKFDLLALRANGAEVKGVAGDSMIAHFLLQAGARAHGLDDLTREYFGHENISITSLIGKGRNQKSMSQAPTAKVCDYAGEDADAAWRLCERFEADLVKDDLKRLYDEIEVPLIEVVAEMEWTGIRLDVAFLAELSVEMEKQLERIEKDIHQAAGKEFNILSLRELRAVLFDDLKLPVQGRTDKTNEARTDQDVLDKLARLDLTRYPQAKVAASLVEHRQFSKLKGTYVDALPALVNKKTGRLHTSFSQIGAETGRFSSSDPNLQNIPIKTQQGQQIRRAFLPREGWKLLSADYSQVELRLLAHLCADESLHQAFAEDRDIHASVAAEIYKVPLNDVSSEQRRMAKTVNFGVIYGMSAFGLAEQLNITRSKAGDFIDMYFARYPKVLQYQDNLLRQCRRTGFVQTILGRRRHFSAHDISERPSYRNRRMIDRQAINMEIQGSAADLMKVAMLAVQRRLRDEKKQAKMLLTVHDELVFEVPPDELPEVAALVRHEMANALNLQVPLKVDLSAGDNWLETNEI